MVRVAHDLVKLYEDLFAGRGFPSIRSGAQSRFFFTSSSLHCSPECCLSVPFVVDQLMSVLNVVVRCRLLWSWRFINLVQRFGSCSLMRSSSAEEGRCTVAPWIKRWPALQGSEGQATY